MRIAIGADHAGFTAKQALKDHLQSEHQLIDFGTGNADSCDYPDFAAKVATAVSRGEVELGILLCGTGIGMSIVANKFKGIRAGLCHNEETAELSRKHNHCNVLCLGARVLSEQQVRDITQAWLGASPEPGRHHARVEKISEWENK